MGEKAIQHKLDKAFKNVNRSNNKSNEKEQKKYFFRVTLDAPLREVKPKSKVMKTAVTDRIISENDNAFMDCRLDGIARCDDQLENSDFFDTIILNNDED